MNWDYVGGFFDGEGSIARSGRSFRISIAQTNEEILNEICDFAGVGHVFKVTKRKEHWKDSWVYHIGSKKDIHLFLKRISPYLILKKDLAGEAISCLAKEIAEKEKIKEKRREIKRKAKSLRRKGWSYRKIGRELKVDWGDARRLILDLR